MGQIIYLEPYQIAREEELHHHTLQAFPWHQVQEVKDDYFEPLTRFWSTHRRVRLDEATVRLLFESFALGFKEQHRVKSRKKSQLIHDYRLALDTIIDQVVHDFAIPQSLGEWKVESVLTLFDQLAIEWFIKGAFLPPS